MMKECFSYIAACDEKSMVNLDLLITLTESLPLLVTGDKAPPAPATEPEERTATAKIEGRRCCLDKTIFCSVLERRKSEQQLLSPVLCVSPEERGSPLLLHCVVAEEEK
ncbi:hypothetical protein MRB53_030301 [Persea americana]|uniref:Uncharacterized protein n=1 Tax=Persea americana TaxID=3435 RepID=A0ACC2KL76_PERAE|nr:hypothetical protein MRB53_030301 [Persea americana]